MANERTAVLASTKARASDTVMGEVERLNSRLNSILSTLHDLRDRVSGSTPEDGSSEDAESAFSMGGFVGGVGQALERAHRTLSSVHGVVDDIANVI